MPIQIIRNVDGNCIEFRGSSNPVALNNVVSGEVDATFTDTINVINTTATAAGQNVYEFFQIPYTEFRDEDNQSFDSAQECADYITLKGNVPFSREVNLDLQGYYARLTNFYFAGGLATETVVASAATNSWITPNFTMEPTVGLFDKRPNFMKEALADPFDVSTSKFSLDGLTTQSSVVFRASMSFEPDEDGGQVDVRLMFTRNGSTQADGLGEFPIETVALSMEQGADIDYAAEPNLTFFVGDTIDSIDTRPPEEVVDPALTAGQCRFQFKTTVPGTLRMRALTWYITQ